MLDGMRYITDDLLVLRRMTRSEFDLRMDAAKLRRADQEEELAKLAIYIRRAQAHRKDGTYIKRDHTELFDVYKVEKPIYNKETIGKEFSRLLKITENLEEYRQGRRPAHVSY